jgi:rubrerythrin
MTIDVETRPVAGGLKDLTRRSARLELDGIDFASFADRPLDADTLRCLRYMHDVENHTMCYLRDVLVTRAHRDPEVTAFLACWCYEEHWHGDALAQVLEAHGEPSSGERVASMRRQLSRRDSLRPLIFGLGSAFSEHMVAIHMAWGAVNEWTTQAGYGRLAARAEHPVLSELLHRIMKQEGRHIDFYASQARQRLSQSPGAQRFARFALRRLWAPVGSGVMPKAEVSFLSTHLFADPGGRQTARRVDRGVDRLPGLSGLHLLEGAVTRYATEALAA